MSVNDAAVVAPKHLITLVDGSPDAQAWINGLVDAAQKGIGNWPHTHDDIPRQQIALATLWNAIERTFTLNGLPWSIVMFGFPQLPNLPAGGRVPDPDNNGSILHKAMHAALGDFH